MPSLTKIQSGFMEAQGALPVSPGTAAAPGLKFSDHSGTGMFSPSTGAVGFSTSNAQQALTILADGNVGIGTDNPSGNLNISYLQVGKGQVSSDHSLYNYNTSFTNNAYQNGNGTFAHITSRPVGVINLQDNVLTFSNGPGGTVGQSATLTERLRITSDGDVGIGVDDPDVYSLGGTNRYAAIKATAGYAVLNLVDSNNSGSYLQFGNPTVRRGSLHFDSNSNFLVTINENGSGTNLTEKLRLDLYGRLTISGQGLKLNPNTSSLYTLDGSLSYYATNNGVYLNGAGTNGWLRLNAAGTENNQNSINIFGGSAGANITMHTNSGERLRITSTGKLEAYKGTSTTGKTSGSEAFTVGNGGGNHRFAVYPDGTTVIGGTGDIGNNNIQLQNDGIIFAGAAHFTKNLTPTSGRGIEIFEASAGVGQISSYNRTGNSWDELRLKGSEVAIYTGTSNSLGLYLQSSQSTLYGTSDGIFNLDTTDGRGSFIRFKENGTSKAWVGCSEGLGTGGDQDDLGLRSVGGFRLRTGTSNRIEISDEGQILFRPITGGFTTSGAAGTFPGAAVAIDCHGVGPGTGTNIPQYGLYVDAVGSSNDASLMTGIYAISKHNIEAATIGVHGLYERDWNSYARKIGGLFQAPARASRYSTLSMNPGGGIFMNTSDTGHANKLTSGGNRPDGNADGGATYGDCTALWGDVFRSDTDTSAENLKSVAIKATNRTTHALKRVGLLVGMVDGNDGTGNRKNTQYVEYYSNSNYQRYYARNDKKEVNHHYPLYTDSNAGHINTLWNVQTGKYYIKNIIGLNQYSWYFFNCYAASYARNGRLKLDIAWTTGHAAGIGEGSYSVAYSIHHGDQKAVVRRFTRFHQYYAGGSYYGWHSNPHLDIFQCTSTGSSAGIYLRVRGHVQNGSFDAYGIQSIRLEADENTYGFPTESSFRFVGNSTPSDADTSTGAITISTPNVS